MSILADAVLADAALVDGDVVRPLTSNGRKSPHLWLYRRRCFRLTIIIMLNNIVIGISLLGLVRRRLFGPVKGYDHFC